MPKTVNSTQEEKRKLRQESKLQLNELLKNKSGELILREKNAIKKIQSLKEFKNAKTILIYHPLADEANLSPLFENEDKTWVLPRAIGKRRMVLFKIKNFNKLKAERFGIMVPDSRNPYVRKEELDLIIISALAIDKDGYRLGRGGAYYDQLITELKTINPKCKTLALCFKETFQKKLPIEEHDTTVDKVVKI